MAGLAIRALTRRASPAGPHARLSVLIFHGVMAEPDLLRPGEPTAPQFEEIIGWLARQFNILRLADAIRLIRQGDLPERAAAITFDDGYANNHDVARPVLLKLGVPSTFFVSTGYIDGGVMFNDVVIESVRHAKGPLLDLSSLGIGDIGTFSIRSNDEKRTAIDRILRKVKPMRIAPRAELVGRIAALAGVDIPKNLMMTSEQVKAMHQSGMDIGAHTVSHPLLTSLDDVAVRTEIETGRARLEAITGQRVDLFAYPNGQPVSDYLVRHVNLVRELGFSGAVSTAWGSTGSSDDLYQIRRFTPWDRSALRFGVRMLRNLSAAPQAVISA